MLFHPRFAFLRNYVLRGGFRDGATGLLVSKMNAYYVFLKLAKLWELQHGVHADQSTTDNPQSAIPTRQSAVAKSAISSPRSPIDKS